MEEGGQVESQYFSRVHTEPVVLDIGQEMGALILYTDPQLRGKEIEVSPRERPEHRTHTAVLERHVNGRVLFAAVFPALPAGTYTIWGLDGQAAGEATILSGGVAEVCWQPSI
jgi:hypothetical protein